MIRYIQLLDQQTFYFVFSYTSQTSLAKIARVISKTADGWMYLLFPFTLLLLQTNKLVPLITVYTYGFIIERSLYFILKNTIKRKRPYNVIKDFKSLIIASDEFSLPSGHTSAAFYFASFLSVGLDLIYLPMYLWAACVAMSRVILGVHFITDVIIGAAIGTSIAFLLL